MANNNSTALQLPAGYEDGVPVAGPLASASQSSKLTLPPGYEDGVPVAGPLAQTTSAASGGETYGTALKKAGSDSYGVAASLAPATNTEAATTLPGKALGLAEDVAQGINNLTGITTVVDSVKNAAHLFDAYEQARSGGASVTDALKAANERGKQLDTLTPAIIQRGKEWSNNKGPETLRALGDAVAAAAAVYGAHGLATPVPAAPEAATAVDAGEAAGTAVGKLAEASAGRPNPWWAKIKAAVSPTAAAQPDAQAALRSGAEASATDAGVTTPVTATPGAGVRTLMVKPIAEAAKIEDGLYATVNKAAETDMKSLYDRQEELQDAIDDPTQVHNKSALQEELKTTQANIATGEAKVQSALGKNASKLISQAKAATQQRFAMEAGDAKLFNNESVVKGNVAHGSNETINVDAAIRQAEILDKPSKFAPRGTPTRLQQMFGEEGAKNFKDGLYDAQKAGQKVVTRNKVLGWVGGSGVVGGALGLGYEMTK